MESTDKSPEQAFAIGSEAIFRKIKDDWVVEGPYTVTIVAYYPDYQNYRVRLRSGRTRVVTHRQLVPKDSLDLD